MTEKTPVELSPQMLTLLQGAKGAKTTLATMSTNQKNEALEAMASALLENSAAILAANDQDMAAAQGKVAPTMLDRLKLTQQRLEDMARGMRQVAQLEDPVGRILEQTEPHSGLRVQKVSVPMGVIAVIYESRPNVTADVAALTLKSGNVCVLRGGKEAINSATAIVDALHRGLAKVRIPQEAINLVTDTSRDSARQLMTATDYVDLLIPRGGAGLINSCVQNATVPCIATGTGICHVYVDASADISQALAIVENAKTSRPSVCNAEEVLLVHKDIAPQFLPLLKELLVDKRQEAGLTPVELRLDAGAAAIIPGTLAGSQDFDTEFLDYILAVACVDDCAEAVAHIAAHSTGHSEAIVATDSQAITTFTGAVDSAAVYVNASTRFTDGGEFGLGCEIGISTQRLHARGPMGLRELNTYKYVVTGNGHVR